MPTQVKADLVALLARVEAAEGPDREIEFDLCEVLGEKPKRARGEDDWSPDGDAWAYWPEADRYSPPKQTRKLSTLGVTASLDAALALVERVLPGAWWAVGHYGPHGLTTATVSLDGKAKEFATEASTPALALLVALLKALIAADADTTERKEG